MSKFGATFDIPAIFAALATETWEDDFESDPTATEPTPTPPKAKPAKKRARRRP